MSLLSSDSPIVITPEMRLVLEAIVAAVSILIGLVSWLALRGWRAAREFHAAAATLAKVPLLVEAVFGVEMDPTKPGALRRLSSAEVHVDELRELLGLSDPAMKREAIRRRLLGDVLEDTGAHRRVVPEPLPPPPPRRRPPLPTTYAGEDPGGEDGDQ